MTDPVLVDITPQHHRIRYTLSLQGVGQAVFGIVVLAGPALGPTLGGLLTDSLGWRWIFFINVPFGILTVLMALAYFEPDRPSDRSGRYSGRIDWAGIALMALSLGSLQLVLEQGHQYDWFENQGIRQLALLAALSYGLYFALLDLAADGGALWATTTSRAMAAVFLTVLVLALGHRIGRTERRGLGRVLPIGLLDALATLAFALASTRGLVSLVAVIACLYPITTAALAYVLLGERLGRWQALGAALAVAGVAMIVATA